MLHKTQSLVFIEKHIKNILKGILKGIVNKF